MIEPNTLKKGDYITFCMMDGFNRVRFESMVVHHFTNEFIVSDKNYRTERKYKMKNMSIIFVVHKILHLSKQTTRNATAFLVISCSDSSKH